MLTTFPEAPLPVEPAPVRGPAGERSGVGMIWGMWGEVRETERLRRTTNVGECVGSSARDSPPKGHRSAGSMTVG